MSTASSDDTHEAPASLHEINPWPCPHCRYDLRSNIDSWKEESVTCPECGESSTAIEILDTMYVAAPVSLTWKALSWLPAFLFSSLIILSSHTTTVLQDAIIGFVFLVPFVWLLSLNMYRYRVVASWTSRLCESIVKTIIILFFNVLGAIIILFCVGSIYQLFVYIF